MSVIIDGTAGITTPGETNTGTLSVAGVLSAATTVGTTTTGALTLPVGTTAQRPTGATGMTRFNSTTGYLEYYTGTAWVSSIATVLYTASYYLIFFQSFLLKYPAFYLQYQKN